MNRDEAFRHLGLPPTATANELRAKYLELAKRTHPDGGGNDEQMGLLAEAYAAATQPPPASSTELVLAGQLAVLSAQEAAEQRLQRQQDQERAFREVVRHRVTPLKTARRQRAWAATVAAGLAALVALGRALGLDKIDVSGSFSDETTRYWISATTRLSIAGCLAVISAALGLLAWRAGTRASWIENAVEDAKDTLSDKNAFLQVLDEIARDGKLAGDWTRADLVTSLDRWVDSSESPRRSVRPTALPRDSEGVPLVSLARITGPSEFANLVITSGVEHGLLAERRTNESGRPAFVYRLAA